MTKDQRQLLCHRRLPGHAYCGSLYYHSVSTAACSPSTDRDHDFQSVADVEALGSTWCICRHAPSQPFVLRSSNNCMSIEDRPDDVPHKGTVLQCFLYSCSNWSRSTARIAMFTKQRSNRLNLSEEPCDKRNGLCRKLNQKSRSITMKFAVGQKNGMPYLRACEELAARTASV